MSKKLFIGGIPYSVTSEDLKEYFSAAGTVESATHIADKMKNNRPAGYGFVEMATEEEAQKAISMFHDKEMQGRMLTVKIALPPRKDGFRSHNDEPRNRRSI